MYKIFSQESNCQFVLLPILDFQFSPGLQFQNSYLTENKILYQLKSVYSQYRKLRYRRSKNGDVVFKNIVAHHLFPMTVSVSQGNESKL